MGACKNVGTPTRSRRCTTSSRMIGDPSPWPSVMYVRIIGERFENEPPYLLWGDERRDVRGDRRCVHFLMTAGCCRSLSTAASTECRAIKGIAFLRDRRKGGPRDRRCLVWHARAFSAHARICSSPRLRRNVDVTIASRDRSRYSWRSRVKLRIIAKQYTDGRQRWQARRITGG